VYILRIPAYNYNIKDIHSYVSINNIYWRNVKMAIMNKDLESKIEELKKNQGEFSKFVDYMKSKGLGRNKYSQPDKVSQGTIDTINEYFKNNEVQGDVDMINNEKKTVAELEVNENALTLTDGSSALSENENLNNIGEDVKANKNDTIEENNVNNTLEENKKKEEEEKKRLEEEKKKLEEDKKKLEEEKKNFELDKKVSNLQNKDKKTKTKKTKEEIEAEKENARLNKLYKTQDNIVYLSEEKITEINNVQLLEEDGDEYTRFGAYVSSGDLAQWFMDETLTFDPTMQRGVKEIKITKKVDGEKESHIETRAFFTESHLNKLYKSLEEHSFTPTQILLGVIVDDGDSFDYDEYGTLTVSGKIRLLDGQHRVRTFVREKNAQMTGESHADIDLQSMLVNVEIYCVTADKAREIYANTGKSLRLNQAQTKQLSSSFESRIVNFLNQDASSELKNKIATTRPVNKKLVLFNTLTEKLEKAKLPFVDDTFKEMKLYLRDFFNYLTSKLPEAFGSNEDLRIEFRENNLLNENNMFKAWIPLALADKEHYKENIDKMIAEKDFFNKGNSIWEDYNTVKVRTDSKTKKRIGWSMNNTGKAFKGMTDETFRICGIELKKENNEDESKENPSEDTTPKTEDTTPKTEDTTPKTEDTLINGQIHVNDVIPEDKANEGTTPKDTSEDIKSEDVGKDGNNESSK
jgi:hypothetical protein